VDETGGNGKKNRVRVYRERNAFVLDLHGRKDERRSSNHVSLKWSLKPWEKKGSKGVGGDRKADSRDKTSESQDQKCNVAVGKSFCQTQKKGKEKSEEGFQSEGQTRNERN